LSQVAAEGPPHPDSGRCCGTPPTPGTDRVRGRAVDRRGRGPREL